MDKLRLAVLIDADNIPADVAERLVLEAGQLGCLSTVRIYGDWSSERLKGWKEPVQKHGMLAVHQFSHARGKNSTDIALVIDAMDLLHDGYVDAFCLVSSDSDFTRLALRIRASGKLAYGFGTHLASSIFVAACNRFTVMDGWGEGVTPQEKKADAKVVAPSPKPDQFKIQRASKPETPAEQVSAPIVKPVKAAPKAKAGDRSLKEQSPSAEAARQPMDARLKAQLQAAYQGCKNIEGKASGNDMKALLSKSLSAYQAERPLGYSSFSALLTASKLFGLTVLKGTPNRKRDHLVYLVAQAK